MFELDAIRAFRRDANLPAAAHEQARARLTTRMAARSRPIRLRRLTLIVTGVLLALLAAVPALGVPERIANLLASGEPAPPRTEQLFSQLDRGAPPGLETRVLPGTARKAFDASLPGGGTATLWVAPTGATASAP